MPVIKRPLRLILASLLIAAMPGCANVPLQRASVEKLPGLRLVQVVTPALEAPTFMQAALRSGTLAGAIPALIVQGEGKTTLTPPLILDFGALVTENLKRKLPQQGAWWPPMTPHEGAVPGNYVYPGGAWLRVEVKRYEIAAGFGRLLINVSVSLLNSQNRGESLWEKQKAFSGLVHGGEKIAVDKLPDDPLQLNRELERAAEWIANELAAEIR
jgi:hypothetical protein